MLEDRHTLTFSSTWCGRQFRDLETFFLLYWHFCVFMYIVDWFGMSCVFCIRFVCVYCVACFLLKWIFAWWWPWRFNTESSRIFGNIQCVDKSVSISTLKNTSKDIAMLINASVNLVYQSSTATSPPHWFQILSLIDGCTLRKNIVNTSLLYITLIINFLHPLLTLFFSWGPRLCCPQSLHLHTKQWKKFPYLLLNSPAKIHLGGPGGLTKPAGSNTIIMCFEM